MKKINIFIIIMILLSFSVNGALTDDLTAYWSLDSDATDDYHEYDFTIEGDAEHTTTTQKVGDGAYILDGTDRLISGFTPNATAITYMFWVKINSLSDRYLMNNGGASGGTDGMFFYLRSDGDIDVWVKGNSQIDFSSADLTTGTWYMLTFTWDGTTDANGFKLYIDGDRDYTGTIGLEWTGESSLGTFFGHTVGGLQGTIDEIVIWDRVLTSSEIQTDLWNSGAGYNFLLTDEHLILDFYNETPLNDTNTNSNLSFNYNLTIRTQNANCSIYVGTTLISYENDINESGIYNLNISQSNFSAGYNTINLTCIDSVDVSSQTKEIFFDDITPYIDYVNFVVDNTSFPVNGKSLYYNVNLNVSCSDDNLYYMNITLYNTSDSTEIQYNNISYSTGTNIINSNYLDFSSFDKTNITLNLVCADAHTNNNIPNFDNWNIPNGHIYDGISITTNSDKFDKFETIKLIDRYVFNFSFNVGIRDFTLIINSDNHKIKTYRDHLIIGEYWLDFINNDGWVQSNYIYSDDYNTIISFSRDTPLDYVNFNSIGLINLHSANYTFIYQDIILTNISILHNLTTLNSSLEDVGYPCCVDLQEIEYFNLSFDVTLNQTEQIDDYYFNYTAHGTNGCALGNTQYLTCYNYSNPVNNWITVFDGYDSSNYFNTGDTAQGDSIEISKIGNDLSYLIDEHYNPNIFKYYPFNFSNLKWQNDTDQRIHQSNLIKFKVENVPVDADDYKLDFRVLTTGTPAKPLEAYACNSSYSIGLPQDSINCVLVSSLYKTDFQDDGTKFRSIFTNNLIEGINTLDYIILHSQETAVNKYYSLKSYKNTSAYVNFWDYSTNNGATWNEPTDDYKLEININWFYDGSNPTGMIYLVWFNTTLGRTYTETFNQSWDIDPNNNYPPLGLIKDISDGYILNNNTYINFSMSDPNTDNLNTSFYLINDTSYLLISNLNQSNDTFKFTDKIYGNYNLSMVITELNTTDTFSFTYNVDILVNNTVTTTTTTTTTIPSNVTGIIVDMTGVTDAMNKALLVFIWLVFLIMTMLVKGKQGKTPPFLALFLVFWGVPLGISFLPVNLIYGVSITFSSLIVGFGKMNE